MTYLTKLNLLISKHVLFLGRNHLNRCLDFFEYEKKKREMLINVKYIPLTFLRANVIISNYIYVKMAYMGFSQQNRCTDRWSGLYLFLKNFCKVLNASDVGEKRTALYFQMRGWLTIQGPLYQQARLGWKKSFQGKFMIVQMEWTSNCTTGDL